jgi:hypothetical protein
MFPPRTAIRTIFACMLACGLLAITTSAAAAECPAIPDGASTSCLEATATTPHQDLRSPDARDAERAEHIARAMENYYSTYGEPKPVAASPAAAPDEPPFLLISVIAGGLALVLASTALALVLRRRRVAV